MGSKPGQGAKTLYPRGTAKKKKNPKSWTLKLPPHHQGQVSTQPHYYQAENYIHLENGQEKLQT